MSEAASGASAATPGAGASRNTTTLTPMTPAAWVSPRLAALVVSIVALVLLAIVLVSIWKLDAGPNGTVADPNAGTIAALAGSGIAALTSLSPAYFGIKVATEQSAQAAATTARALEVLGNSTSNGNPTEADF